MRNALAGSNRPDLQPIIPGNANRQQLTVRTPIYVGDHASHVKRPEYGADAKSQILIVLSMEPDASCLPSGLNAKHRTLDVCPRNSLTLPFWRSQI